MSNYAHLTRRPITSCEGKMEGYLKKTLGLKKLVSLGACGGGCISDAKAYDTDIGRLFVKQNTENEAMQMMKGELESLNAINNTNTLTVPHPHGVLPHPSGEGAVLVVEYVDMKGLHKYQSQLGEQLAMLHLHNQSLKMKCNDSKVDDNEGKVSYVSMFGFHVPTCCGRIPQDNTWCEDWMKFYRKQKLQFHVDMILKRENDRELEDLWTKLAPLIPKFFEGLTIEPALLHGDLWSGNVAETDSGPVAFDPSSFYGHSEFDLGIAGMFGGFSQSFYSAYHKLIPRAQGFEERHQLYLLFHHLNHWNHFGGGYRSGSLSLMRKLIKL